MTQIPHRPKGLCFKEYRGQSLPILKLKDVYKYSIQLLTENVVQFFPGVVTVSRTTLREKQELWIEEYPAPKENTLLIHGVPGMKSVLTFPRWLAYLFWSSTQALPPIHQGSLVYFFYTYQEDTAVHDALCFMYDTLGCPGVAQYFYALTGQSK